MALKERPVMQTTKQQNLSIAGSLVLFVGVFMPAVSAPFFGSFSFLKVAGVWAFFLLLLSGGVVIFTLREDYKAVRVTGFVSLAIVGFVFLADLSQPVGMEFGWAFLLAGPLLVIYASGGFPFLQTKRAAPKDVGRTGLPTADRAASSPTTPVQPFSPSPGRPIASPARTVVQTAPPAVCGSLECVAGALAGHRFEITRQGLLIGRDPAKCQIVVQDEGVSREHAWVVATDEGVVVIDRGSSNGTYVNSVEAGRVTKASLRDGDRVLIGPRGAAFVYSRD
jgi:FHA domain